MTRDTAPPLSHLLRIDDLREKAEGDITVSKSEMAAIAALLDLKGLEDLTFFYRLRPGAGGRLHLNGRLKARVTQTCVVTLDPVESSLDVPVEAEFWPQALITALEQRPEDPIVTFEWPEPIRDGKIDLGPLIYETLATSLDPYPKREGASFEWSQGTDDGSARTNPFAALEALKRR
jgi:Large ribosomal RNA subunit accumulation protein YceD